MPAAFQYRPKFVDIRVRPPKIEAEAAEDVHVLEPGERSRDHQGSRATPSTRATKKRDLPNDHNRFCQPHAAQYKLSWK